MSNKKSMITSDSNLSKNNKRSTKISTSRTKKIREPHHRRGRSGRRTKEMVDIGKERIRTLFILAEREAIFNKNKERAQRYVTLARKIAMRYNIKLEKSFRQQICRSCNSFLISVDNSRIRFHGGKRIIYCKTCGRIYRIPIDNR